MSKWMVAAKKADFNEISEKFGISVITARLIRNRDVIGDEAINMYINGGKSFLHDPYKLPDIEKAAEIILKAIDANEKIRVIGDYDVDGVTSSFILKKGLEKAGANVDVRLPHRVLDGYGLNDNLVKNAKDDGINVIMTCDNGIAAAEQVQLAKELNMTVVVTDHHEVPYIESDGASNEVLPPADAIVDPKRKDCEYPFKEICGAVVAYKFLEVLFDKMGEHIEGKDAFLNEMIVFAGLATVCDVMPLSDENRIFVKESLKRIKGCNNFGLQSLIRLNGLDSKAISCYHYGFIIGPCLNATGRLSSASTALELLDAVSEDEANELAEKLVELNGERKTLTEKGVVTASEYMATEYHELPKVIVIYLKDSHESVAGIIAGKLKEKYNRPALVITDGENICKGSGRSIDNYDMFAEMSKCRDLFTKFGGHKMAAGFSLEEKNIDILRQRLNDECRLSDNDFEKVEHIDMVMPLKYATMNLVKEFKVLEPFGNANKKPVFAERKVQLISGRIMGKNQNCGKYSILDSEGRSYEMVYFGDMERWTMFLNENFGSETIDKLYEGTLKEKIYINIAYAPDINVFRDRENLQIVMQDFLPYIEKN